MKKGLLYVGTMVVAMGFATSNVNAQDEATETGSYTVPAMEVITVVGGAPSLTLVEPTIGGTAIALIESNTSWINYTSIVATDASNKVSVAITTGAVPAGTTLKVVAAAHATAGDGTYGTPGAAITLSADAQDLITAIGSCYTGTGAESGHQLTYTWSVDDDKYATVKAAAAASITATYTITANTVVP